eukprot:TRINITY_DN25146_c0_g1_i2.p1 TRINITY_DN25146_c0_g1~~TRINITY_DN25146_c0_g1_i2.p1  ORF type:complete len:306 (-),score=36.43 TRINITY_DN25146_c0_g1_i2:188-1105(-)
MMSRSVFEADANLPTNLPSGLVNSIYYWLNGPGRQHCAHTPLGFVLPSIATGPGHPARLHSRSVSRSSGSPSRGSDGSVTQRGGSKFNPLYGDQQRIPSHQEVFPLAAPLPNTVAVVSVVSDEDGGTPSLAQEAEAEAAEAVAEASDADACQPAKRRRTVGNRVSASEEVKAIAKTGSFERLRDYIVARHSVSLGEQPEDPIVKQYRFCQLNRLHDRTTQVIGRVVAAARGVQSKVLTIIICRLLNRADFLPKLGPMNRTNKLDEFFSFIREQGAVFSPAYRTCISTRYLRAVVWLFGCLVVFWV